MKHYLTPLFLGVKTRAEAKAKRIKAYKPKALGGYGLRREKLYLVQDTRDRWRVIRRIYEWELADERYPAERKEYLREQTRRVERWMKRGKK